MRTRLSDSVSLSELRHMREVEGLSNAEIAERLNVSVTIIYRYLGKQPPGMRKPYKWKSDKHTKNKEAETAMQENDVINHPKHYTREGAMESIDEMLLIFGREAVKGFCLCNAWKYRYRASMKNGEEDIKKSDWYIAKYKELAESAD